MRRRVTYSVLSVLFLVVMMAAPLNAAVKKIEGRVAGEVVCLVEWETDEAYQGSKAKCLDPNHTRALVTSEGEIYILEPAENASEWLVHTIKSNVLERKNVIVKGEVVKGGKIKLVKVSSIILE